MRIAFVGRDVGFWTGLKDDLIVGFIVVLIVGL